MADQFDQTAQAPETADFAAADDPFVLFRSWMAEAAFAEPIDPEAMAVATVDPDGLPNVRMILLKGADERGFVFYTNRGSAKGQELAATPKAALLFYWKSLGRQIRIRGPAEPTTDARRMPISPRGIPSAASALAPPSNRGRWKAALCSKPRSSV